MHREKIITNSWCRILFGLLLVGLFTGCARLPDYAMPRHVAGSIDPALLADAVTYRPLRRTDFRANSLPPDRIAHAGIINAYTCAQIRPTADSRIVVRRAHFEGERMYTGTITAIGFEAIMVPGCSWWNPALPERRHAYVLEHEQIHFALLTLTARRLTIDVRQRAAAFMVIQPTADKVRTEITATVNAWIAGAVEQAIAEHTAFDEATSLYYSPRRQRWWRENVDARLAELPPSVTDAAGQPALPPGSKTEDTRYPR